MLLAHGVRRLGLIVFLASTSWLLATPANKAALEREFDRFLGTGLDRCTTCHLPSENSAVSASAKKKLAPAETRTMTRTSNVSCAMSVAAA